MKKNLKLLLIGFLLLPLSGCFKRDSMEQIDIYTTVYPIEYITERLYGESSNVYSIYPDGIDVNSYELTDKQIKDYSKSSLFIFNGLSPEKNYVLDFFKENKNIKIIDTTLNMEYNNKMEELWLNPSNLLMLAQNIKNGLDEYINNHYLKNKIQSNYDQLKIDVSNIDAKLKLTAESATTRTIVVSNDLFKFLEKYDLNVISLENNANLTDKVIADATALINSGEINYIFVPQNEELNDTIKKLQEETNVEIIYFHTLSNISETERNDKLDYLSIMNNNIELIKKEIYE
ncbi:MAG: metal ABC transporter substrate-binding protein [Ignavibacteriales bacterium]